MASAIARDYNGGLEQSSQRDPGAEPLVNRLDPSEAKALLVFECSMEAANLPTFPKFENAKKSTLRKIMDGHETGG